MQHPLFRSHLLVELNHRLDFGLGHGLGSCILT